MYDITECKIIKKVNQNWHDITGLRSPEAKDNTFNWIPITR